MCVHKLDLGREEDMLLRVCVCVYVQRGPSPTPQVNVGFFARNYYRLFFFKIVNVYSYSLVFCVLIFPFWFHVSLVSVVSVVSVVRVVYL